MNWLRSRGKRLSLLALFALALQFGLSFGHFHNDIATAAVAAASQQQAAAADGDSGHDLPRDLCAICVTMAMAGMAIAASAPPLPLPLIFATLDVAHHADLIAPPSRHVGFRSRAPPRS